MSVFEIYVGEEANLYCSMLKVSSEIDLIKADLKNNHGLCTDCSSYKERLTNGPCRQSVPEDGRL